MRRAPQAPSLARAASMKASWPSGMHRSQVAVTAVQRHRKTRQPRRGLQRLSGRRQHRRPGDLQQVPQLLTARAGGLDQPGAAGAEVTQPRPRRISLLGQVAVQLGRQPGDEHRVLVIVLAPGVVLGLPGPGHHQRLHAHQRDAPSGGQLGDHHPPVTRRLARHRDPRKARRQRRAQRPLQQLIQLPRRAPGPPPRQHPRIMIGQGSRLPRLGQINTQDRVIRRQHRPQRRQPGVTVAITPRQAVVTLTHGRPPCVLGYQARHHTGRTSW